MSEANETANTETAHEETPNAGSELRDEMKESIHRIWLAGLGAMATAEEEGSKLFRNLVERGETFEGRGKERWEEVKVKVDEVKAKVDERTGKAREKATSTWDSVESRVDDMVASAIRRSGVPTRDEIATLSKRVDELITMVEKLQKDGSAAKA